MTYCKERSEHVEKNDIEKKTTKRSKLIHSFVGLTDPDHVRERFFFFCCFFWEKAMEREMK